MFKFNHTPGRGFSLFCLALFICHTTAITSLQPYMDFMNLVLNLYTKGAITKDDLDSARKNVHTTTVRNISIKCGKFRDLLNPKERTQIYENMNNEFEENPASKFTTVDVDMWFAEEAINAFYAMVCFLWEPDKRALLDRFSRLREEVEGKAKTEFKSPTKEEVTELGRNRSLLPIREWEKKFGNTGLRTFTPALKSYSELLQRLDEKYTAMFLAKQMKENIDSLFDDHTPFPVSAKKYIVDKGVDLNIPCDASNDQKPGKNVLTLSNIQETLIFWCIVPTNSGFKLAQVVVEVQESKS